MNFARFCRLNASKFPDREFIIESYPSKNLRKAITWKELNDQTNKLANFMMKECGVKKGDIVVHLMMNSIEWYVAYMAVLKTGATVTPLNFRFASSDIKYAADVTKCKVFILGDTCSNQLTHQCPRGAVYLESYRRYLPSIQGLPQRQEVLPGILGR